jgi:hypothetical protein
VEHGEVGYPDAWGKFSSTIKTEVDKAIGFVNGIKAKVDQAFKDVGTWLLESGKNLVQGFIDGISKKLSDLRTKVQEMTDLTKKHTQQQLEAKSPSQVFFRFGADTVQGFINGFDSLMSNVQTMLGKFTDIVKKIAEEKLKLGSPSKIFFQYGSFTIQGYIDGLDSLMSKAGDKIKELVDLVNKTAGTHLKIGSPSKVFFGFGVDTIQGFIDGIASKYPELQQLFGQVKDLVTEFGDRIPAALSNGQGAIKAISDLLVKGDFTGEFGRLFNVQEDDPLVDKLLTLRDMMIDKIPGAADKARAAITKLLASGKLGDLAGQIQPIIDKVSPELQKISDRIRPPLDAIVTKIKSLDLATPMQKIADKMTPAVSSLQQLAEKLKPMVSGKLGRDIQFEIQGLIDNLKDPVGLFKDLGKFAIPHMQDSIEQIAIWAKKAGIDSGTLARAGLPSMGQIQAAVQPIVNVPATQFPQKMILKVGDREFDAYVDGRADSLLSQAAALLSRGVK